MISKKRARLQELAQEMRDDLKGQFPQSDYVEREEAIYWYAYAYHEGQYSDLYAILSSVVEFKPGRNDTFEDLPPLTSEMVDYLIDINEWV